MCVDDEGCLWVALPFSGDVRRYSPTGELVDAVRTPAVAPTSCTFGGPQGDQLLISTWLAPEGFLARRGEMGLSPLVTPEQAMAFANDEVGGALLVCRPGVTGPPASLFAA